jgi:hypothetical protein
VCVCVDVLVRVNPVADYGTLTTLLPHIIWLRPNASEKGA